MSEKGVSKETKLRFAAFAGVLLLVSGLVIALFDEAQAVTIDVQDISANTSQSSTSVFVDMKIPGGQRTPIQDFTAVIESDSSSSFSTTAKKTASTVAVEQAAATCNDLVAGCTSGTLTDTRGSAITAMSVENFYVDSVSTGYVLTDTSGYYATGYLNVEVDVGYGYSSGPGYGYEGVGGNTGYRGDGEGQGYGYIDDVQDLIIRFQVTINPSSLGSGNYWMTFFADSGSSVIGTLSSPAKPFTVSAAGGGGGGGGGTGGGDSGAGGGGPPSSVTVTANNVNPTGFAVAAYRSSVASLAADGSLTINVPNDPLINEITFVPGSELTDAEITVQRFTTDQPPADVGSLPSGVSVAGFIQVTVSSGGTNHQVTIALTVPEADAGDPDKAVLIKWDGSGDEWTPHGRIALTLDGGVYSGTGTAPCCSFFAVAFDEEDPNVTLDAPDGDLSGTVQLTATADDNLGVQKVEFWAGNTLLGTDTSEPWSLDFDTTALANGDHTIRAVAYDHVDNTAESSQDVTVQNEDSPGPTGTDGGTSGGDGDDGGFNFGVLLLVLIVLAVIGFAGYYFYKQQGQK